MQLFDQYGAKYGETVQRSVDFSGLEYEFFVTAKTDLLKRLVLARHGPDSRPSLLDVGCGIGSMHDHLKDTFDPICGVDVSASSIEVATARNPNNEYRVMAGLQVPYESARFDFVIAVCVFHHVELAERPKFMIELKRVARPGGLVCIIEHNPYNPLTRLAVMRCPFDKDARLLSSARTRHLMRSAGLAEIKVQYFLLLPFRSALSERFEFALSAVPLGAQYASIGERPTVAESELVA
jgi:ubiquinone/menaquinone biosynthesis C-methylase UbiE